MNPALEARLGWYWRLEAINVFLLPVAITALLVMLGDAPGYPLALAFIGNGFVLGFGASYWFGMREMVRGDASVIRRWVSWYQAARPIARFLVAVAVAATLSEALNVAGAWPPSLVAALLVTLLLAGQYLNYFSVQCRHGLHADLLGQLFADRADRSLPRR